MPDPSPKLRAVGEGERPARRRKGPGLAVILVGLYGLAFAAALWVLESQASKPPPARAADAGNPPGARPAGSRSKLDRQDLLSGAGLEPEARSEYLRRLAIDCCDCGCDLTLSRCLVSDQKCARSAQMAEERRWPLE
jgi:hypothetical protein